MENPIASAASEPHETPASQRNASGIWSIDGDRLVSVEDFDEGPTIVLVHCEHVLVLAVDLPPIASLTKRRAALPFAIEDRIAEPLSEVHVALGAEISPNRHLAAVVRHDLMRRWVAMLNAAGLEQATLVPDCIGLPVPGAGSWAVDLAATRGVVRLPDHTGFALPHDLLEPTWLSAGSPACIGYGDPLPPAMHAPDAVIEDGPMVERLLDPDLDLRQGPYAPPRKAIDPLWRRVAVVAACGALAHATIAVADTLALGNLADTREAEVRALVQAQAPLITLGPDLSTTISELEPERPAAQPSAFLALVSVTAGAFATAGTPIAWRSVAYDSVSQTLTLEVASDNPAGLETAGNALLEARMEVRPGAVSTDGGRVIGSFQVTPR